MLLLLVTCLRRSVLSVLDVCSCKARLGSYNWAGSQSESGAWVTPAFQLHHSKIDAMSPQTAAPLNIRQPLLGPAVSSTTRTSTPSIANPKHESTSDMRDESRPTDPDEALVPVDAARTVSDAAHTAAQIAAHLDRPAIVPQTDRAHVFANNCIH